MSVKVGDKVRNIAPHAWLTVGEEVVVSEISFGHIAAQREDGGIVFLHYGDYEIITNEEDDNMTQEKAQVGDLIRVVALDDGSGNPIAYNGEYELGDILEVEEGPDGDDIITTTCGALLYGHEYVIHRKAGEESVDEEDSQQDAVNPQHYKQGRVEVIDIIEDAVQGADPFEAVCQANVLKYALRYRHKNGVEDLRKAVWYTEKLIAYLDAKSTQ